MHFNGDDTLILGVSIGTVSKDIREYQRVLSYRGTIHELGRAITHEKIFLGII